MIIANIYNHPLQWCSTVPQVPTSVLHTFYMHTRMQSQVARTRSDRVLHMHRTTRRAIRQTDRAEPLQPLVWSMATPESLQGERSPTCAASHEHPWVCTHACSLTLAMRYAVAAIGRSDRCGMSMHAAHRAVAAARKGHDLLSTCKGSSVHYD